jgi:hypothetical protein
MAVQHRVNGADGWQLDVAAVAAPQLLANLGGAPARMLKFDLNDERFHLHRQLIGLPVGAATAVGQSTDATILVAFKDFVAGLARNIELAA